MRHSLSFKIPLLLPLALLSMGCDEYEFVTLELRPSLIGQDCPRIKHRSDAKCGICPACVANCPDEGLLFLFPGCVGLAGPNELKQTADLTIAPYAGWEDNSEPSGTQPCPCTWYDNKFSRTYVKFDVQHPGLYVGPSGSIGTLSGEPVSIFLAEFRWTTAYQVGEPGYGSKACIKYLSEATGDWTIEGTPEETFINNLDVAAVNVGAYGVTKRAQKWFQHPEENHGLIIEPKLIHLTPWAGNDECWNQLTDLRLLVGYKLKKTSWPGF